MLLYKEKGAMLLLKDHTCDSLEEEVDNVDDNDLLLEDFLFVS